MGHSRGRLCYQIQGSLYSLSLVARNALLLNVKFFPSRDDFGGDRIRNRCGLRETAAGPILHPRVDCFVNRGTCAVARVQDDIVVEGWKYFSRRLQTATPGTGEAPGAP